MKVVIVIGTRPQIIKSAPIIHAANKFADINLEIVHTGQHYDYEMSRIFFNELELPEPIVNLGVGSGSHAWQTGKMMIGLEKAFIELEPDIVLVPGDTNSTLAAALSSVKLHIPVAHIEAGARSYDMKMPEEVNRRLTDHCSKLLFVVSENCAKNLSREGIPKERIIVSGDTMYESLLKHLPQVLMDNVLKEFRLFHEGYVVLTIHRPENVDEPQRLKAIIEAILGLKDLKIVFPCHPRTKVRLQEIGLIEKISMDNNIILVEPVGYHRMLNLIKHAKIVFTDSGGMQKEAFWLKTPCITLRDNTEWVETVDLGFNILVGSNPSSIIEATARVTRDEIQKERFSHVTNPYDVGGAADKILKVLYDSFSENTGNKLL